MYCHFCSEGDSSGVDIDWSMTDKLVAPPFSLANALVTDLTVAELRYKTGRSTASLSRLGFDNTSSGTS